MKKGVAVASVAAWCVVAMVVVLAAEVREAAAACNPVELAPCLGAISTGSNPPPECCSKLKEQQPCFCGYIKNPALRQYVESPNAKKVASFCGVSIPTC